ncbi:MAG: hypothetical protein WBV82_30265 [Myxococcaceae bacterium]
MPLACGLCARSVEACIPIEFLGTQVCFPCSARLGRALVTNPALLSAVWPVLEEEEDDGEPEPRVRLSDGRSVELRERTAEMKKDLPLDQRMRLAMTLGELGLHREQILECGFILSVEPPEVLARLALSVLFANKMSLREPMEQLQTMLFPS